MKIFSKQDIKSIITMRDAIDSMQDAFRELANNTVTLPLRTPIQVPNHDALSLYMPAYLQSNDQLGIKIASIYPHNHQQNIPAINGVIVLLNAKTGQVKAILDAEYLTALRTGAASGLATEMFARSDSKHVAILGSGAQAHTQLEAVACVRPISTVSVWSRTRENAQRFADGYANKYHVNVCETPHDACMNADVICAATSSANPLIHLHDVTPHCHINAVGAHTPHHSELAIDLLSNADVFVDQVSAVMAESGEIINAVNANAISSDDLIEIGHCVDTDNSIRQNKLTVFKSVGLAIQDIACGEKVLNLALTNHIGTEVTI